MERMWKGSESRDAVRDGPRRAGRGAILGGAVTVDLRTDEGL